MIEFGRIVVFVFRTTFLSLRTYSIRMSSPVITTFSFRFLSLNNVPFVLSFLFVVDIGCSIVKGNSVSLFLVFLSPNPD